MFKAIVVKSSFTALACALSLSAHAFADAPRQINIPAGDLIVALESIAKHADVELVFRAAELEGLRTKGVSGVLSTQEAVRKLLEGTQLRLRTDDSTGAMMISGPLPTAPASTSLAAPRAAGETVASSDAKPQRFWDRFRVAQADDQATAASDTSDTRSDKERALRLEEIVVTAQKRKENVQDVAVAISAFTADMIESRGITRVEDLQFAVPGLNVGVVNRDTGIVTLRGVGAINSTIGGDPGVALYVDGHYVQSPAKLLQDFLDLERIEVQRGPQGTLYGRNSMGGNISIITKRPTSDFEAMASVDLGNYDKRLLQGVVSGPFSDNVRGRLAVSREKRDGYLQNTLGPDMADSDYINVRSSLEVDLTDTLQGYLTGSYFDDTGNIFFSGFSDDPTPRQVDVGGPFGRSDRAKSLSLDFTWQPGELTFRSLSAYDKTDYFVQEDATGVVNFPAAVVQQGGHETYSQEFQLLSSTNGALKWVTGLFYYHEKSNFTFEFDARPIVHVRSGPTAVEANSFAGFGQIQYAFNPKWELVAGVRYNHDKKDLATNLVFVEAGGVIVAPGGFEGAANDSWDAMTYKAGLNYHMSDDMMLYASFSKGYKAGGYNNAAVAIPAYGPEFVEASEIGVKSEWLEQRLQLNLTGFHYDYKDKQENVIVDIRQGAGYITNAAAAVVDGVELEVRARPTRALSLDTSAGYMDARYESFNAVDSFYPELGLQDISGRVMPQTSKWKYSLGGQYDWSLGGLGSLNARVDYSWTDRVQFSYFARNEDWIPSYDRINARLQWQSGSSKWMAELYGQNLRDELTVANSVPISRDGRSGVFYLPPRTYGLKVRYQF